MSFCAMESLNPYSSLTNVSESLSFELLVTSKNHPNWCPWKTCSISLKKAPHLTPTSLVFQKCRWNGMVCGMINFGMPNCKTLRWGDPPKFYILTTNLHQRKIRKKANTHTTHHLPKIHRGCKLGKKTDLIGCKMWKAIWCLDISFWCFLPVEYSPNDSDIR